MLIPKEKIISLPNGERRLLFHCCCAPCAGGIIERLLEASIELTVLFYNPNIQPVDEYERRKAEVVRFARNTNVSYVDLDYEPQVWLAHIAGLENEPEKGRRCLACFNFRLTRTAQFAKAEKFSVFATSLGISRWKDLDQVNHAGKEAAAKFPGVTFWDFNWRKENGANRRAEVCRRENFYRQNYCGCVFSRRKESLVG